MVYVSYGGTQMKFLSSFLECLAVVSVAFLVLLGESPLTL
jgi:hypothetical protein